MTIGMSLRQSFGCVGVYLIEFVFGHGLLAYDLLARGRTRENVKVCLHYRHHQGEVLSDYFTSAPYAMKEVLNN
jgi:hypothetical protein